MYKEVTKCRICGNSNLELVTDLGKQYLTGIFPKKQDEEITIGPLELVKCFDSKRDDVCGLVQLRHTYDLEDMYGDTYGYRSGLNKSMIKHLTDKVYKIEKEIKLNDNDFVLDIGSNDATLLKAYTNKKIQCFGVDPSAEKFRSFYTENINLITEFFPSKTLKKQLAGSKFKVITSIAMFYDLEQPLEFVKAIHEILDSEGVWIFEQSYMPEMIKTRSYDTICHEHIEYYCLKQIKWMLDKADFKIVDIELNDINGGSFSVKVAKNESKTHQENVNLIKDFQAKEEREGYESLEVYKEFEKAIELSKSEVIEFLTECKRLGKKVFGYGASTKGNVLLQYCNITSDLLPYIAEVNEDKFEAYTPGTKIPIISEKEARLMKPDYFFVLPWHFKNNILEKEKEYIESSGVKFVFPLPEFKIY